MIENSSAGLVMLGAEVAITVTREEHHQAALARYAVAAGSQRRVAVELGWCVIGSGKYRGQRAIEVRLDGQRVGELTYLMSQRYAPLVSQVSTRGGRPGCEAVIQRGTRGLEVLLDLPRNTDGVVPMPTLTSLPSVPPAPQPRQNIFAAHRPAWIGAAVVAVIFIAVMANGNNEPSSSTNTAAQLGTSSTTQTTTTTTVRPTTTKPTTTTTTATTTTTVAPAPVPPPPAPKVPQPAPVPAPQPEPQPAPEPAPQPSCDPNYTGCVPIASDVDCAGGSGNGPAYVAGPIRVIGNDIYGLDNDHDGIACE